MSQTADEAAARRLYHGGDLAAARRRFPDAPRDWLDLSTGVNPLAYRFRRMDPDAWARLPDPGALGELERAAAEAYGARHLEGVVAAPGAQALIQWLPQILEARSVAILGFTYGEHARAWERAGARVAVCDDLASLADADVVVAVNPNNPDGRLAPLDALVDLAERLAARGGALVVDEAFMEASPEGESLAPRLPANTIVLRSFGKIYGLAGLRLGFAIAAPALAGRLRERLGPWAVSGPAIAIGRQALADRAWLAESLRRLSADAARLDALVTRAGFAPIGGTLLFRLVEHAEAARWFERLGRAGILVRPFPAQPRRLRFGLPHGARDWLRLEDALLS